MIAAKEEIVMDQQVKFVAVKFRPGDTRTYTYRNDGEPVAIGDRVLVATAKGEQTVFVVDVTDQAPPFATKAIVGKAPDAAEPPLAAGPDILNQEIGL